jgi:hypothetical protein
MLHKDRGEEVGVRRDRQQLAQFTEFRKYSFLLPVKIAPGVTRTSLSGSKWTLQAGSPGQFSVRRDKENARRNYNDRRTQI